jgi:peptide methionine sulfoxide reductase MsrB
VLGTSLRQVVPYQFASATDRCCCMQTSMAEILLSDRMSDRPGSTEGFTSLLAELARAAINLKLSRSQVVCRTCLKCLECQTHFGTQKSYRNRILSDKLDSASVEKVPSEPTACDF